MAVATVYTKAIAAFTNKEFEWDLENFSAMLLNNTHVVNQNTHQFVSDISAAEITGGSYARVALAGKAITEGVGLVKLTASDVVFAAMTATAVRYMAVFRNTGLDTTSKLICIVQFTADIAPSAQSVTFNLSTDGLLKFTLV